MALSNPAIHKEWLTPHSLEWYNQLSKQQATYDYPWDSKIHLPTGESIFKQEVLKMIQEMTVLDIGCGDGTFAKECSQYAKFIVGIDATDQFVLTGNSHNLSNVKFVVGNTKEALPFQRDTFDCVYNRKGPTSSYPLLSEVVKKGGTVVGLHPGDANGKELVKWFPNFFAEVKGKPILEKLELQLSKSEISNYQIKEVHSTEYLKMPIDVVKYRCFGQTKPLIEDVINQELEEISKIFSRYKTSEGMPIKHSRYIVRAVI